MIDALPMNRPATALLMTLFLGACGGPAPPVEGLPTGTLFITVAENSVAESNFALEVSIAETPEAQTRGLMGVEELDEDAGMVFLHEEPTEGSFWMKDTLIPLSIAFWDRAGEILAILDMEPCREDPCRVYDPGVTWIGAVEVNQGYFDHRIEVGETTIRLER
jgi:uncharacterized membrane protein (UPF0127 family)